MKKANSMMRTCLSVSSGRSATTRHRHVGHYHKERFASIKNWVHKYGSQSSSYYTFKRRPFQQDEVSPIRAPMPAQVLQKTRAKSKANLEWTGERKLEENPEKNEALDEMGPARPLRARRRAYSRRTRSTWVHSVRPCLCSPKPFSAPSSYFAPLPHISFRKPIDFFSEPLPLGVRRKIISALPAKRFQSVQQLILSIPDPRARPLVSLHIMNPPYFSNTCIAVP
jgi:hypothetical protein